MNAYQEWENRNCANNCGKVKSWCGGCKGIGTREDVWRAAIKWSENQHISNTAFEAKEAINSELRG